eukprot:scaffold93499_cov58-Phaeocystis_antarctica.AAC.5
MPSAEKSSSSGSSSCVSTSSLGLISRRCRRGKRAAIRLSSSCEGCEYRSSSVVLAGSASHPDAAGRM